MMKFSPGIILAALGTGLTISLFPATPASAISLNIGWTGANGYTLTGNFSYPDALIGTGRINGSALTSFNIQTFLNGSSLGTWNPSLGGTFNFNFDTTTETFFVGGTSGSLNGQIWGINSTTVGFVSGSSFQALTSAGAAIDSSFLPVGQSTLTATRAATATVPEPGTVGALALLGLGGLATKRVRRTR